MSPYKTVTHAAMTELKQNKGVSMTVELKSASPQHLG